MEADVKETIGVVRPEYCLSKFYVFDAFCTVRSTLPGQDSSASTAIAALA